MVDPVQQSIVLINTSTASLAAAMRTTNQDLIDLRKDIIDSDKPHVKVLKFVFVDCPRHALTLIFAAAWLALLGLLIKHFAPSLLELIRDEILNALKPAG